MGFRSERDSMGKIQVEDSRLWGAQTQRSLENFPIGLEKMPTEIIEAFAILKKAAAQMNQDLGELDSQRVRAIHTVCDEILAGRWPESFRWLSGRREAGCRAT